jgi:hypothetical protein
VDISYYALKYLFVEGILVAFYAGSENEQDMANVIPPPDYQVFLEMVGPGLQVQLCFEQEVRMKSVLGVYSS